MSMTTVEEKYDFSAKAKKNLLITIGIGIFLTVLGIVLMNMGGHHEEGAHEGGHAFSWVNRLGVDIWINNIYFTGIAIVGVFFFALQYAAQAGWSAGIKRIPLAFGSWLPIAGILMLVSFFVFGHDLFHWTHHDLYDTTSHEFDSIINAKKAYFFWPLSEHPSTPVFFIARMLFFFGLWYYLFTKLRKLAFQEDLEGGTASWYNMRKLSAVFLIIFAVTSSIAAWDWVMSIDTHWFSTMFGWYVFASWWVTTLALITFITIHLKEKGLLSIVNENHLHDIGKFVFAFSVFWAYIWFSQFLLIYYANIPEETIYFVERWNNDQYGIIFFVNLFLNFVLPFLLLMPRDAKRHTAILKVVTPIVIFGHWIDFYLMITPGTLKENGGYGLVEFGTMLIYGGAFLYVVLNSLSKAPLFAKNDPMLDESLHHHVL
ncbi:quinol:cytochrome C oxidoreductase [Cyclobacteriaceae bacterium]|nr:quinol:cytochrome C oxidoreductase [Cyclobacteriaceae bacterium]MDC1517077.1 quinol:cytochrome C oxidoreductase [Cyclobacteriaceae bacterium]